MIQASMRASMHGAPWVKPKIGEDPAAALPPGLCVTAARLSDPDPDVEPAVLLVAVALIRETSPCTEDSAAGAETSYVTLRSAW